MTKKNKEDQVQQLQEENINPKQQCDCQCECEDEACECEECNCERHHSAQADEYLALAQRLQADFDNYRKRVAEQLDFQRLEGVKSVIEVFLPCLDTFKEAKKSITDEKVLSGVDMIEEKIISALKTLNVEKIESVGQKFDPHLHNVIALVNDPEKENDMIIEEFQSGWMLNGKVIRYSKVIVNKI